MKIRSIPPFPKRKILLRFIMRMFILLFCTTVLSFSPKNVFSQKTVVSIEKDVQITVDEVFDLIRNQTDYKFIYKNGIFDNEPKKRLSKGKIKANKLLSKLLSSTRYNFQLQPNKLIIITVKNPEENQQDPIKVTGRVTDESGLPLVGATVRISGTDKGVITDFDGKYFLIVDNLETELIFSSLGFTTQKIKVGNQTVINVSMSESLSELDEVVLNAGYYKIPKRKATGSIAKVEATTIEKQPVSNPVATLHGRMAGVQITQSSGIAGGGFKIQIRGQNSLRRNGNDPLIIVDGMPFSMQSANSSSVSGDLFSAVQRESPLNSINPADIESIEVLKDADATAIYGSRGANGVVLITTKKGDSGKTKFDVNMYSGFSTVTNTMNMMNAEQYLEMRREAVTNDGFGDFLDDPSFDALWPDIKIWGENPNTDWQEQLIGGTAMTNNIQASISGGNELTQFIFSGGYYNETTVFPGDFNYQRVSGHLKVNHISRNGKFKFNGSASYVADNNDNIGEDFTERSLGLPPNAPTIYDEQGNLNWENFDDNPLALLEQTYLGKTKNLISNVILEYEITRGLTLMANLGYNTIDFDESKQRPSTMFNPAFGVGSDRSRINLNNTNRQSWIVEPQLNWKTSIGKGKLDFLIGASFQEDRRNGLVVQGIGFPDNSMISNIGAASDVTIVDNSNSIYKYAAIFGRANYVHNERYILNITGRRDGSSRFGPGKQFANFMAVGAAWLFSEENLFKDSNLLSFGKLRTSYGSTGSDQIGDYQFLDSFSVSGANYDGVTPLFPTQLFNDDFAWEVNKKFEVALELGLFNDNILLNIAHYRNRSSNQLIGIPLSALTGFTTIQSNFPATVQNTGLEVELNTINIQSKNFTWRSSFNITIPKNKLLAFPDLEESDAFRNRLVVGEPINIRPLFESTGVDSDTGAYTYTDFNDDGNIDFEDRQIVKTLDPEFFGGLSNSLTYKGFQFDFLFQFVKKEASNYGASALVPGINQNQPNFYFQDRWQNTGDTASIQRYTFGLNGDAVSGYFNYLNSDLTVSDASFVRLKNISLSYTLSEEWTKRFNVRLYIQGQNLWTITDYFGLDPETVTNNRLPTLKTITMGAQFTF